MLRVLAKYQTETTTRPIHQQRASQLSGYFLSYTHRKGSELKQMDIKTAYLNTDTDEETFMQQPEGFEKHNDQGNPLVRKLNKSLYGLKQSAGIGTRQ